MLGGIESKVTLQGEWYEERVGKRVACGGPVISILNTVSKLKMSPVFVALGLIKFSNCTLGVGSNKCHLRKVWEK